MTHYVVDIAPSGISFALITVEAALNAELDDHLALTNTSSPILTTVVMVIAARPYKQKMASRAHGELLNRGTIHCH